MSNVSIIHCSWVVLLEYQIMYHKVWLSLSLNKLHSNSYGLSPLSLPRLVPEVTIYEQHDGCFIWSRDCTRVHLDLLEVHVAYHCSFLCCPIVYLYVPSSMLWCPVRFPPKNDVRHVCPMIPLSLHCLLLMTPSVFYLLTTQDVEPIDNTVK